MSEERTQRRLAAIFAADVAGYSRLMGADEEGTLARLKVLRHDLMDPKIEEHRGRIVKTTGDGLLVEFASVVDALRCAVEIQRDMAERNDQVEPEKRIEFRIGINVGDIVIEAGDIYGDGVNVAARLEALADPGGICVSSRVQEDARGKLDLAFDDLGEQRLKNIAWPLRVYRVRLDGKVETSQPALAVPAKPSIAILPFTNMSGDSEQEYFSDGITEDIITGLSRFRSLFVIARNSSFAYKGRSVDARQIARDLGVRYVVEGSVRRSRDTVRVTAQLIDGQSGNHLWAERIDRRIEDIFSAQDDITRRIIDSVAPRIDADVLESANRKPPEDMRAYEFYLRAKSLVDTPHSTGNFELARKYCDRAIQLDSAYARAYAYKALSYVVEILLLEAKDLAGWRRMALENAEAALALDPMDGVSHWAMGEAALQSGQREKALNHMARALALNPNDADVMAISGYVHACVGDGDEGLRMMDMAIERNPYYPGWYQWLRGFILLSQSRYDEALHEFNRYGVPNASALRWRAATLVALGRIEEAKGDIRLLQEMQPGATVGKVKDHFPYLSNLAQVLDGLRKAGLPE